MIANELDYLYRIQSKVTPCFVELPNGETSYGIDLQTRQINSPEFLSVKKDHLSNVIYFNIDRFFDYMDLSTLPCVIIYQTPDEQVHVYPIPYYDIYTLARDGKMVLPWNISNIATQLEGDIIYSIRFFKIEGDIVENANLVYNLSTFPAKSKILNGLDAPNLVDDGDGDRHPAAETLETLIAQVKELKDNSFTWTIINDE